MRRSQAYLLGPVQQVGPKPVDMEPQIAEHDEARADIKRVRRTARAMAGRVEHRCDRPEVVNQLRRQLAWMPACRRELSRQPVPGTFHHTLVGPRGLVAHGRVTYRVQGRITVGDVCEHDKLLLPRMTEVAALLDYVRVSTQSALKVSTRRRDQSSSLLMSGIPREVARDQVRAAIDRVLAS